MRLIRGTSARLRWSNSESSRIQTRRICIAGVFAAQVDQFIGEVLAGHCARCSRFSDSLRAFENQATFGLRPGQENPCDGRDELARSLARDYSASSAPKAYCGLPGANDETRLQ